MQAEDGYLTPAGIAFCAEQLGLTRAEVTAVATFYSMYRRTPTGDYLVGVCTNTLCAVMGGDAILEVLEDHLGVARRRDHRRRQGHPRAHRVQRRVRLRARGDGQLGVLRQPDPVVGTGSRRRPALRATPVTPTRGAPLCTFRETARILAGFPDERPGANDGAPRRRHPGRPADRPRARHDRTRRRRRTPTASGPDDERITEETVRDEPAPAPSADVPPKNGDRP